MLALETKSLLLGESATREHVRRIEAAITQDGTRIIHLKTLHLGPEELLVAAKISVTAGESGAQIAESINSAEDRIRSAIPITTVIYLEPDLHREQSAVSPSVDSAPHSG